MTEDRREENDDLDSMEVLDGSDTLDADPGDDPLDTGVIAPDRWSSAMRFGSSADEGSEGEPLDQLLAEEEPDEPVALDDERPPPVASDENATEDEVAEYADADGPDPRAGRLVGEDEVAYDGDGVYLAAEDEFVARDVGIDGAGASAEEAAVHVSDRDPQSPEEAP
jgi:hypothetical protein